MFGIDLGTTYSAVAYVDETGRPTVVPQRITNSETTPSVVYFESPTTWSSARPPRTAAMRPDRVVSVIKREMGKDRAAASSTARCYTPESISALILKPLAAGRRELHRGPVEQVVITVPAYFGAGSATPPARPA